MWGNENEGYQPSPLCTLQIILFTDPTWSFYLKKEPDTSMPLNQMLALLNQSHYFPWKREQEYIRKSYNPPGLHEKPGDILCTCIFHVVSALITPVKFSDCSV